jgi:hypothetical protein
MLSRPAPTLSTATATDIENIKSLSAALHGARVAGGAAAVLTQRAGAMGGKGVAELLDAIKTMTRGEEKDDDNASIMRVAALLEARLKGKPAAAAALKVSDLPPADVADVVATTVAEANRIRLAMTWRGERVAAKLSAVMSKVHGPTSEHALQCRLDGYAADAHLTTVSFAYAQWTRPAQLAALCRLLATQPNLVVLDLSYCFLGTAFVEKQLLPAIAPLQHLACLSLVGNALSCDMGTGLSTWLATPATCRALRVQRAERHDITAAQLGLVAPMLHARHGAMTHQPAAAAAAAAPLRVLSLDGFGMQSLQHLQWLMCEESRNRAGARHAGERYDLVVASSFGAVIACALAARTPLAKVDTFFAALQQNVFASRHSAMYYAEAAGRGLRQWWTGGDYYSGPAVYDALTELFGDHRFDFVDTQVMVVLAREPTHAPVLACSYPAECAALRQQDIVAHDAQRPLVRDVVAAAMSIRTLLAPRAVPNATASVGADKVGDALTTVSNPVLFALAEAAATPGLEKHSITSVGFDDSSRLATSVVGDDGAAPCGLAMMLEATTPGPAGAQPPLGYQHLHVCARESAFASHVRFVNSFADAVQYTRVAVHSAGAPSIAVDEGSVLMLDAAKDAALDFCGAAQPSE